MNRSEQKSENARATEQALRWMRGSQAETALLGAVARSVRQRRRRFAAGVAGVGAMALGLWLLPGAANFFSWPLSEAAPAPTAIVMEPRRAVLPDGSVVALRDGAEMAADFSATVRRVTLRHGEAHFEVVKDAARPFVVQARGVEVRAVGTAFSVGLGGETVEVLVTHGRVAVEPAATAPALVDAGQGVRWLADGTPLVVRAVSAAELAQSQAWRTPQIEFSRTPLAEALDLINARLAAAGQRRIAADPADAGLRDLRLSGFLAADNAEGFLLLLERSFGVRADRAGAGAIMLRSVR